MAVLLIEILKRKKEKVCAYSKDLDQLSVKLKDTVFSKSVLEYLSSRNFCLRDSSSVERDRSLSEGRLGLEDIGRGRRRIVGKI